MDRGYLKLWRKVRDSWLWKDRPFSYGQAWIDLLMRACHTKTRLQFMKRWFTLESGQLVTSERILCETWGWSRGKVRRFLSRLKSSQMIVQLTVQKNSVITICKYSTYNSDTMQGDTTDDTTNGTTGSTTESPLTDHEEELQAPREAKKKTPKPPTGGTAEDKALRKKAEALNLHAHRVISKHRPTSLKTTGDKKRVTKIMARLRGECTGDEIKTAISNFAKDSWWASRGILDIAKHVLNNDEDVAKWVARGSGGAPTGKSALPQAQELFGDE